MSMYGVRVPLPDYISVLIHSASEFFSDYDMNDVATSQYLLAAYHNAKYAAELSETHIRELQKKLDFAHSTLEEMKNANRAAAENVGPLLPVSADNAGTPLFENGPPFNSSSQIT